MQNPKCAKTPYYAKCCFPIKIFMSFPFPLTFPLTLLGQSCFFTYRQRSEWMRPCYSAHLLWKMMLFHDILPLGFWTAECSENLQSIRPMSPSKQLISNVSLTGWKCPCFNGGNMASYILGAHGCSSPMLVQCGSSSSWLGRNPSSRVYDQKQCMQTCCTKGRAGFSKLHCWKSFGFRNILEKIQYLFFIHSSYFENSFTYL